MEHLKVTNETHRNTEFSKLSKAPSRIPIPNVASHKIADMCVLNQRRDIIDLGIIRVHLFNEGRLTDLQVCKLLDDGDKVLKNEPNLLRINKPTTIIGDIHGQFYDLVQLITRFDLSTETILFLGDYVDRGSFSTEVYFYLLLLKINYPNNVFLLRGNHESKKMTEHFTFKEECKIKYSLEIYRRILESFKCLPLAAVVLDKVYCSHGGISPSLSRPEDINKYNRFTEIHRNSMFCDILWSDPHPMYDDSMASDEFEANTQRGCSYFYTYKGVTNFLKNNKLWCIIRGHEVKPEGHALYQSYNEYPSVITVFSAPNYCDVYRNKGGIITFDGEKLKIKTFYEQPHPFCLPNFLDGINWSFPFICEKISEFYLDLLKELDNIMVSESSSTQDYLVETEKSKTENFVCSMAIMRSERECAAEIIDEESEMISSLSLQGNTTEIEDFEKARVLDKGNEELPADSSVVGVSISMPGSLSTSITKELENKDLDDVLDESRIVLINGRNIKIDVSDVKEAPDDSFICWWYVG